MSGSWTLIIGAVAAVVIGVALLLGPWVAGIALLIALAVWGVLVLFAAPAGRTADEAGISESPGEPGREPTPPAEPSH